MTRLLQSLFEIASDYDAIVLDQWGVLHDGATPYPHAIATLERLSSSGIKFAVLSNSGKRSEPNAKRIQSVGFSSHLFEHIMSSGEALWRDVQSKQITETCFHPIERTPGDAQKWAQDLDITLCGLDQADAILLMGLPDGADLLAYTATLDAARAKRLPVYCSNPDFQSPRPGGGLVTSPGALAFTYAQRGGTIALYGKPYEPIFRSLETALGTSRLLMVGDSLDHDVKGAAGVGWDSLLIMGGLYAKDFGAGDAQAVLADLLVEKAAPQPTYMIETLK